MNRERLLSFVFRNAIAMLAAQTVACGGCEEQAETITVATCSTIDVDATKGGKSFADVDPSATVDEQCKNLCRTQKSASYTLESCGVVEGDPSLTQCTFTHYVCTGMRSSGHCGMGRPPAGYVASDAGKRESLGDFFAHASELEAASITAFRHLELDLVRWGAPAELVDQARAARRDEVVHARMMRDLARRHGSTPRRAHRVERTERPLVEVAIENAVEGCVNETYAALVATWAADHAADPLVQAVMARIAEDETRHAALAWAIDAWAASQLSEEERARVSRARSKAVWELVRSVGARPTPPLLARAGVEPCASDAAALAFAIDASLWQTTRG